MSEHDRFAVTPLAIAGALAITPKVIRDDRGFFVRTFDADAFAEFGLGLPLWLQENQSRSTLGTLRGLHFRSDTTETKLVRCVRGAVFEAIVDLRPNSPSYLRVETLQLDDVECRQVVVPGGCAHGFQVLTDLVDVAYRHSATYDPAAERAVRFDDVRFGIVWPNPAPLLSESDRLAPSFEEVEPLLAAWFSQTRTAAAPPARG